jgi:hypothetical protein
VTLSASIENLLRRQGRTKIWLAKQCAINYKTFVDRMKNDRLTAYDLLNISVALEVDLNELKSEVIKRES